MIQGMLLVTLVISLVISVILFLNVAMMRPAREQVVFLMIVLFIILYLMAYGLEMTMAAYVMAAYVALKFQYIGLCGYLVSMSCFMSSFIHLKFSGFVYFIQSLVCFIVLVGALTMEYHPWFYKSAEISYKGDFPVLSVEGGWIWKLYYIWLIMVYLSTFFGCFWKAKKEGGVYRKRALYVNLGIGFMGLELIMKALGLFGDYNPVSIAFLVQTGCMYFAFIRYGYFSELETSRDAFISAMSHEMRMPLNSLIGMNELILMEDISPVVRDYAERGIQSGEMLLGLVNDIIDYSQLESGKFSIESGEVEVREMLSSIYHMEEHQADKKDLKFIFRIKNPIPEILAGDRKRLEQILVNLLHNAVKFTARGRILLTAEYTDGNFIVSVEDTGIGIRRENLEMIFLPFERVDVSKNASIEGAGLGLTICRNLAERMGGKLEVVSRYGVGSRFTLTVPMKRISEKCFSKFEIKKRAAGKSKERFRVSSQKKQVLVIDDNEMNCFLLKSFCRKINLYADCAESGRDALKLTLKKKYDLLFIDFKMPGIDGGTLLRGIRNQKKGKNIETPAILLTAFTIEQARRLKRDYHFDGYLTKPLHMEELEKCVFRYIEEKEPLEEEASSDEEETEESGLEILRKGGISTEKGLYYSADDEELYRGLLNIFISENKAEKWKGMFRKKEYKELEVQIHALKNNAMSLGMEELGVLAKQNEGRLKEFCAQNTTANERDQESFRELMELYQEMFRLVKRYIFAHAETIL